MTSNSHSKTTEEVEKQQVESMNKLGINLGLTRINSLLQHLNSPHLNIPIIHIGGTNGKGSTSSYLNQILLKSNLKIGKFNSPFLLKEFDSITINNKSIKELEFNKVKKEVEEINSTNKIGASSFEILTAIAFQLFSSHLPPLDLIILEVGLGGLTDSTNVVSPSKTLLSIITSIELDHQSFLGNTLEEITRVKAGIIKQGVEVIVAKQEHSVVIEEIKKISGSSIYFAGEGTYVSSSPTSSSSSSSSYIENPLVSLPTVPTSTHSSTLLTTPTAPPIIASLPLPGIYQLSNAATAVLASEILRTSTSIACKLPNLNLMKMITDLNIKEGIESTKWPGRLDWLEFSTTSSDTYSEEIRRRILLDGAHNPSSAIHLATYLNSLPSSISPTTLILALSAPRSPSSILLPLLSSSECKITKIILVGFSKPENMSWINSTPTSELAEAVKEVARETGRKFEVVEKENVELALRDVGSEEKVVVAGSLYLVADVYRLVQKLKGVKEDE